jgi:polysaccharide pyruvyl transferase WcaK-like protein
MRKILILGGDSDHNLGDAAILSALCHTIVEAYPMAAITITSAAASQRALPGVQHVIPRRPTSLPALVRAARSQDLIIVGGGGLFQDDDSRVKMPYWASKLALLRLVNANIVGHCLGAGPLDHAESRLFASVACSTMQSISVRDHFAFRALSPCTKKPVHIVPDPAFMLPPASKHEAIRLIDTAGIATNKPIIGVAIRRWFHKLGGFVPHRLRVSMGFDKDNGFAAMEHFLDVLAAALHHLAHRLQASILLLPTYNISHEGDAAVCRRLASKLHGVPVGIAEIRDPQLYKAVTGELALMVASRMHPMILAASMGTPIVGLAYNGKFDGMFDMLGLSHHPLWLDNTQHIDSLTEHIDTMSTSAIEQREAMAKRAAELGAAVDRHTRILLRDTL